MKKSRFKELLQKQLETLIELTDTKGEEYAHGSDDQLSNFKEQGTQLGVSPFTVLAVYLDKHLRSIRVFLKEPNNDAAMSEPITGRIDDAILYLLLLKAMIVEKSEVNEKMAPDGLYHPLRPPGDNA